MRAAIRRWALVAAGVGVLVAVTVAGLVWPSPHRRAPRARQYLAYTACLLTDGQGLAGADAAPVWAGMQDASLSTRAKVQYLAVQGPATVANVGPYLAGLLQRHCDFVIATGPTQVTAVVEAAGRNPEVQFAALGVGVARPNLTWLTGATATEVREAARVAVTSDVRREH